MSVSVNYPDGDIVIVSVNAALVDKYGQKIQEKSIPASLPNWF